jgi:hypothetical protein
MWWSLPAWRKVTVPAAQILSVRTRSWVSASRLPGAALGNEDVADLPVAAVPSRTICVGRSPPDAPAMTEDRMIPSSAQRMVSLRRWATIVEVAASHSVYVCQPAATVGLIEQAARGATLEY